MVIHFGRSHILVGPIEMDSCDSGEVSTFQAPIVPPRYS